MIAECMGGPCDGRKWRVKPSEIKHAMTLIVPGREQRALYWAVAIQDNRIYYAWHQNMKCKCRRPA